MAYETPQLSLLGKAGELTLGNAEGSWTDQDFPAGTLKENLKFSGPVVG